MPRNLAGIYPLITRRPTFKAYPDYMASNHRLPEALRKEYHLD
jgi:hypothetical protein